MKLSLEQIDFLIIAKLAGTISEQEATTLENILATDASAKTRFEEIQAVFDNKEISERLETLTSRIPADTLTVDQKPAFRARRLNRRVLVSVAAMIIVMLGIATAIRTSKFTRPPEIADAKGIKLHMPDGQVIDLDRKDTVMQAGHIRLNARNQTLKYSTDPTSSGNAFLKVPAGRFYNIELADGSTIKLNSETSLKFPFRFTGSQREIWVDGEAFIEVKKDSHLPFIVHLPNSTVNVLGTSFNVNTYDHKEKVSLVSGKVQMASGKDSIILHPGKEGLNAGSNTLSIKNFDEEEVLGWIQGIYVFHNNTLEDVSRIIGRWYGLKLVLDENLKSKNFYGIVNRNEPIEEFLDAIKFSSGITYDIKDNIVTIK